MVTGRERGETEGERSSFCWLIPQIFATVGAGSGQNQEPEHSMFAWWQEPPHLSPHLLPPRVDQQEVRLEVGAPVWDAGI